MTALAPPPNEVHPAYTAWADTLTRWLDGGGWQPVLIPYYQPLRLWDTAPDPGHLADTPVHMLTRRRAYGLAPYVGRPYVYRWDVAVDELGRAVAGNSHIQYTDCDRVPEIPGPDTCGE